MVAITANLSAVEQGLAEFRATRENTLAMTKGLSQTDLDYSPAPDRWSIGEVLDHMLLGERLNREQIVKLIELKRAGQRPEMVLTFSDLNISVAGIPSSLLALFHAPLTLMNMFVPNGLRNYLTRKRLIPFRNPDVATPRRGRLAAELRGDLIASLRETERLFQSNPDLDYEEMIVQHPLLGGYDVPGLLRFMSAHEQRHQSQIAGIQTAPQFPRSAGCCGDSYA
jgi:DinB superfamily